MAASVAIAALLITPEQLQVLASTLETYLPEGVSGMIIDQLHGFVGRRTDNSLAAIIATAVALVGASGASRNMVIASNVAYSATESRGWLVRHVWGVAWVVAGIGFCLGIVTLLSVNYDMLTRLNLSPALISLVLTGRWLMLFLVTVFSLAVFYRYGPDRPNAKWQWVSWGAIIAATVWLVGTTLFFMYIQNFASLTQTYTVFAGIIILMMWMNISVLVILLGAEINYQLETISNRTISPVDKA